MITKTFAANPNEEGMARLTHGVVFSIAGGKELTMEILHPWRLDLGPKRPCIVFVQGSAWTFPDVTYEIPQLSAFAKAGYVVAIITHRNSLEGHPFPQNLEDVKTAIRFMRAHSEEYHIDKNRIALWGTSSGGNLSLLASLTDGQYKSSEYREESDHVGVVVDCFGPTIVGDLFIGMEEHPEGKGLAMALAGDRPFEEVAKEMSPFERLDNCPDAYPFAKYLLLHGTSDPVVPCSQSERMAEKLDARGVETELVLVRDAVHEGNFWSQELIDEVKRFLDENL